MDGVNRRVYGRAKYPLAVRKIETFGERITRLRKELGLSQAALAKACGIKQPSLSVIESGDTKPATVRATTLTKLATNLKTSQDYLLGGIEAAKPGTDPLLSQLNELYAHLDDQERHELVRYANYLHSKAHPEPSKSNPFGKRKRETSSA